MSSKKRKFADDEDRSVAKAFVAAANAVSQLYQQADRSEKRAKQQCRQLLDRQFQWILTEYGNQQSIPTQAMLNFLQLQAQSLDVEEANAASGAQQNLATQRLTSIPSAFGALANVPFRDEEDHPQRFPQ